MNYLESPVKQLSGLKEIATTDTFWHATLYHNSVLSEFLIIRLKQTLTLLLYKGQIGSVVGNGCDNPKVSDKDVRYLIESHYTHLVSRSTSVLIAMKNLSGVDMTT